MHAPGVRRLRVDLARTAAATRLSFAASLLCDAVRGRAHHNVTTISNIVG
ncbi:hypothetical protein PAMC26577_33280 [Caballeronia sordidicola]|uniref:Uncharacterized protein n=1 Tax=Caballeronia sordidicola TaxID=196367 RepID=A0A242MBR5_CABSO|nr:hypothetical protein PAMC26577_33280 [Caballeronia sordidicola]